MQSIEAILSKTHIRKPPNKEKRVTFSQRFFSAKTLINLKISEARSSNQCLI